MRVRWLGFFFQLVKGLVPWKASLSEETFRRIAFWMTRGLAGFSAGCDMAFSRAILSRAGKERLAASFEVSFSSVLSVRGMRC